MSTSPPSFSSSLQPALDYAHAARPIFPLHFVLTDGSCSCGKDPCGKPSPGAPHGQGAGKHPMTITGFKEATIAEGQVSRWWERTPSANVGLLVKPLELALDIDARSGGLESLEMLLTEHPAFPDTPHSLTGGGGHHYIFALPDDARDIKASGALQGFPGIEWKANGGGYLVAPPSNHVSGRDYAWEFGFSLLEIPVAPIPAWLLALVRQSHGTGITLPGKRTEMQGPLPRRMTRMEIILAFRKMYSEGERRVGTGLPRLVGILINQGVDEDEAVGSLLQWQESHFVPPLAPDIVEEQVRAMYRRYGRNEQRANASAQTIHRDGEAKAGVARGEEDGARTGRSLRGLGSKSTSFSGNSEARSHKGHAFLIRLSKAIAGKTGVRTDRPIFSPSGESITREDALEMTRRAIAEARNDALFEQRRRGKNRLLDSTITNRVQEAILLADPRFLLSKEELLAKLSYAEGPKSKVVERLEHCLWCGAMNCWQHGDQFETRCMCRLMPHYDCIHQSTLKIRLLSIPDLKREEGRYISTRLRWPMEVTGEEQRDIGAEFENERVDFQHEARKLGQRKTLQGTMLSHSMGTLLGRPFSTIEGRLMFRLDGTNRADYDKAIKQLCKRLDATIYAEREYQEGESVVVQLMEDSMSGFLGMRDKKDDKLFMGFYFGMKGKALFQGLNELYRMLRTIKLEEPALCPVCGRKLRLRPISPEEEGRRSKTPLMQDLPKAEPAPPPKIEQGALAF